MSAVAARRYAEALLDLAQERQEIDAVAQELDALAKAIESSEDLEAALKNPAVRKDERMGVIKALSEALGLGTTLSTFLKLLVDKGRANLLLAIAQAYTEGYNQRSQRVTAQVRSARALSQDELEALRQRIESSTGKKVRIETTVEPDLLGGIVTQVGSMVFDGSVQGRLNALRDRLIQETL